MFITLHEVELFYETIGSGPPVILLHGNSEDHASMRPLADLLKDHYTIYSLDSRGHGQSGKVARLSYDDMAGDVARFIQALSLDRPLIIGASDGAIIGLLVALQYPHLLGGLIAAGANRNPDELKGWFRLLVKLGFWGLRGDPKMALMLNEPNLTPEMLARIRCPVLVLAGQRDILPERHTRALADAIPGAAVHILRGQTHSSYIKHAYRLVEAAKPFLDALGR